jgi:hypothetical protein
MDIAFIGLIIDCVVVYLDDVTVFSKDKKDHIAHLRKIFNRCRRYDISLNPNKSLFLQSMKENCWDLLYLNMV